MPAPMMPIDVHRYEDTNKIETQRDPLEDLLVYLQYLTADDYLVELLQERHGLTEGDAEDRAERIAPHVQVALNYMRQVLPGPQQLSFLPGYCAILNLLKVYILLSPKHKDLADNRWHGATYDVGGKSSHSLATEEITLKTDGAIPLFYEVVTGNTLQDSVTLQMRDIYPYLRDISAEVKLATGEEAELAHLLFAPRDTNQGIFIDAHVYPYHGGEVSTVRLLKALDEFRKRRGEVNIFRTIDSVPAQSDAEKFLRSQLRPELLYHDEDGRPTCALSAAQLDLPEELSIVLMFFYAGNLVRYKPEFLYKVRDLRYWPVLAALRENGLHKFLLLFWSHMRQSAVILSRK